MDIPELDFSIQSICVDIVDDGSKQIAKEKQGEELRNRQQ